MKRICLWVLIVLAMLSSAVCAGADETEPHSAEPVPIYSLEELLAISENHRPAVIPQPYDH